MFGEDDHWLKKYLYSSFPEVHMVRDKIKNELNLTGKKKSLSLLNCILLNLFVSHRIGDGWVVYSRDKNDYSAYSIYNKMFIGYSIVNLIDNLVDLCYIENRKGWFDYETKAGMSSKIKATTKLLELFNNITFSQIEINRELVVLKDKEGKYIEYTDTTKTKKMRTQLEKLNSINKKYKFELKDTNFESHRYICYCYDVLFRSFKINWNLGGRYYGHWLQTVDSSYRKVLIDGEEAVELDYSGLHINLLYAKIGKQLEKEPYIYKKDEINFVGVRNTLKFMTLKLLCATSLKSAISSISDCRSKAMKEKERYQVVIKDYQYYLELAEELLIYHQDIRHFFHSENIGLELQNIDSQIVSNVVDVFIKLKKPIVPVHDSFIVKKEDENLLRETMLSSYQQVVGEEFYIKIC